MTDKTNTIILLKRLALFSFAFCILFTIAGPDLALAQSFRRLKIGVVNLNRAVRLSSAGKRSRNIFNASKKQKEKDLRDKERQIKKMRTSLKNNIMLKKTARTAKEREIRQKQLELRRDARKATRELQAYQRKLTESIYIELKTVIEQIAKKEKFDLILEQNSSQLILLYSAKRFKNITDKVIKRYDKFQGGK